MNAEALTDDFGIYVHVPYCRRRCPYCDFNVYIAKRADWPRLVLAIERELLTRASAFPFAAARSLYFGGGTPSLMPLALIKKLRAAIDAVFPLTAEQEVTIEVDPATLAPGDYAKLRALGFTRVSLGWQSTHDELLRTLGRGHSAAAALEAYHAARRAGFDDISLDLIFAVPGESMEHLDADLEAVCRLAPEHVSLYALTYHEGTELYRRRERGRLLPVSCDLEAEMMSRIEQRLSVEGYEHYEVSSYARTPAARSLHNQLYWRGGNYLGLGPGAHSFARRGFEEGWRFENTRDPAAYIAAWEMERTRGLPRQGDGTVSFVEHLTPRELDDERLFLRLRTSDGLVLRAPLTEATCAAIARARARGFIHADGDRISPTPLGLMHADSLAELFIAARARPL